ncbi:MAG: hypothetical protein ACLQU1_41600 [Bryobacteraceae bacterium]
MPGKRFALLAAFWTAVAGAQQDPHAQQLCGEANQIAQELTKISGMPLHHPVPCDFITKAKINEFLQKRVKDVAKPGEIRAEELTLKKFGLVPQDFDLAKNTVDLLTEQAAAFYDYDRKKLFITETTPSDTQEPVLAHELSHALADQTYNLGKFIRQGRQSDDGSTARLAVMEGQATWLMAEYLARKNGQSLKDSPALVEMMSNPSDAGGQFPVYENAPLYLRQTLVFPYTKGMLFQNAVFQRDGQSSFAEVFLKPPLSTQQILHPEKYFEGVKPTDPDLPDRRLPHGYKGLVSGSLGELEHRILLEQFSGKKTADEIAPHWRGSNFELSENKKAGRVVLLYSVEWDSDRIAERYFAAYKAALAKKWKTLTVTSETADAVDGLGDDGRFELRRKGAIVTSVEGLDPEIH